MIANCNVSGLWSFCQIKFDDDDGRPIRKCGVYVTASPWHRLLALQLVRSIVLLSLSPSDGLTDRIYLLIARHVTRVGALKTDDK